MTPVIRVSISSSFLLFKCFLIFTVPQCIYFYVFSSFFGWLNNNFTFHNVSISTQSPQPVHSPLLVLYIPQCIYFYIKIRIMIRTDKTLYIPQCIYFYHLSSAAVLINLYFTFHNVSISTAFCPNSGCGMIDFTFHNVSISTPPLCISLIIAILLYIPQCIYFYTLITILALIIPSFTFHNVSISTGVCFE